MWLKWSEEGKAVGEEVRGVVAGGKVNHVTL